MEAIMIGQSDYGVPERLKYFYRLMLAVVMLWGLGGVPSAMAADSPYHRQVDGLSVYLGVLPAALVERRHPAAHPEGAMHGGPPRGQHAYHVMVSVFDDETGERVEDLEVEARVTPLGRAAIARRLEPMSMADTITYGNYFNLATSGPHRIRVSLSRHGVADRSTVEFTYDHRLQ
jgi:hypothetical protein